MVSTTTGTSRGMKISGYYESLSIIHGKSVREWEARSTFDLV